MLVAQRIHQTPCDTQLRSALQATVRNHLSSDAKVVRVKHQNCVYCSSHPMHEFEIEFESSSPLRLFMKDLSPSAIAPEHVKPAGLSDPLREIEVYKQILRFSGLETATYYGCVVRRSIGRYWMFLRDAGGVPLSTAANFSSWLLAAKWLARLHNRFGGSELPRARRLIRYDRKFYMIWANRMRAFSSSKPAEERRKMRFIVCRYTLAIDRLLAMPTTLLHGEYYPANILVTENTPTPSICPVDWELTGVGPCLIDLAALTSGNWDTAKRDSMIKAYLCGGSADADRTEFDKQLHCCRLYLAAQWLGWNEKWNPPPHQRYDWLAEGLRLAEEFRC